MGTNNDLLVICEPHNEKIITYVIPKNAPSFYLDELKKLGIKVYEIELGRSEHYNLIRTNISNIEVLGKRYDVLLGLRNDTIKVTKLMELLKQKDLNINVGIVLFLYGNSYQEILSTIEALKLRDILEHIEILKCDKLQIGIISLQPTDHITAFYNLVILSNIITNLLNKDIIGIEIHFSVWRGDENIFVDKNRKSYSGFLNIFLISLLKHLLGSFNNTFITDRLESVLNKHIKGLNIHQYQKIKIPLCDSIESLYISEMILVDVPILVEESKERYINYTSRISIGIYAPQLKNPSSTAVEVYKLLITLLWRITNHENR